MNSTVWGVIGLLLFIVAVWGLCYGLICLQAGRLRGVKFEVKLKTGEVFLVSKTRSDVWDSWYWLNYYTRDDGGRLRVYSSNVAYVIIHKRTEELTGVL